MKGNKQLYLILIYFCQFVMSQVVFAVPATEMDNISDEQIISEVSALAKTLPSEIEKKGKETFPEIDLEKLSVFVGVKNEINGSDIHPYTIVIDSSSDVNNSNILMTANKERNEVVVSSNMFKVLAKDDSNKKESKSILKPILFHNILVLMGVEEQGNFHISSRILDNSEYFAYFHLNFSKDRMFSTNPKNSGVVYWTTNTKKISIDASTSNGISQVVTINQCKAVKEFTFHYCENKDDLNSCQQLGDRSYNEVEIKELVLEFQNRSILQTDFVASKKNKLEGKIKNLNERNVGELLLSLAISTSSFASAGFKASGLQGGVYGGFFGLMTGALIGLGIGIFDEATMLPDAKSSLEKTINQERAILNRPFMTDLNRKYFGSGSEAMFSTLTSEQPIKKVDSFNNFVFSLSKFLNLLSMKQPNYCNE